MSEDSIARIEAPNPKEIIGNNAGVYFRGIGTEQTKISLSKKPIVIVGSAYPASERKYRIVENLAATLKAEGIEVRRVNSSWPRNWWHYHNGIYIPRQIWQVGYNSENVIGHGGKIVSGDEFHIISKASETYQNCEGVINEYKKATGIDNIFAVDVLDNSHHDIDLTLGYVPWRKLFVFDSIYFEKYKNSLREIVNKTGTEFLLTEEKYGPNFTSYDFSGDQFVISYNPKTSKLLKERGIRVVCPQRANVEDLRDAGGARCFTNILHDASILTKITNQLKGLFDVNTPGHI